MGDLLRSPSENFVRFLLGEADLVAGRVTARVVDRFTPIVRRAIQSTLVDMMTKSLQHEIATPAEAAPLPIPATPAVAPAATAATTMSTSGAATGGQVVTTEEELQTFAAVKRICSDSAAGKPISYKDTVSYFGLNLGKVTHWFLRFVIKDDRRYIVARTAPDKATMLAPGFRVEATSECAGGSRIFYGGLPDLDKLRALIVFAYEEEARRREKGGDDDEDDASS